MGRFNGKVAVVTGAGQGVGFATAKMFIEEGAKVVLAGRTLSKLEAAVEEIGSENAVPFHMDVGIEYDWVRLVAFIKENYGEMDYLVNNAAICPGPDIFEQNIAGFREIERVNMESVFLGMKYCYDVIKKGVFNAIVNVSSVGSRRSGPNCANDVAYVATKAGVIMLTKHAAIAYGKDCIRVNAVLPGGINSPMRDAYIKTHPEALKGIETRKPLPPYCTEREHIAKAILFCCDPGVPSMTGAEILVDSGQLAM